MSIGWRTRLGRLPAQIFGKCPFAGDIGTSRVRLIAPFSGRPTLPFPHPWNYQEPLRILETYFHGADGLSGSSRHNRYLDVPGCSPILVTRDPRVIRAISAQTGDKDGQFDRDTLPSTGIARATGENSLLYANVPAWKMQKKLATPPFARTSLFQPEQFHDFERTFRQTVRQRLEVVRATIEREGGPLEVELEPEIKAIMLEMLVNNFFGASVSYEQIRDRYVPALDTVISHIVTDTVVNKIGLPLKRMPSFFPGVAQAKRARAVFEELTDLVIGTRRECKGQWKEFASDAPDEALRSNIRVFLAGALEATASYASWALSHLARHPEAQEKLHREVCSVDDYTPGTLASASYLNWVLEETLRLTPALYFHPRRAGSDIWVETTKNERLLIPRGTHILLDVWHSNRLEEFWGVAETGFPADAFVPERWEHLESKSRGDLLHFGFGHGPRFCPGKNLGQLEVALVVGACIKLFKLEACDQTWTARAGVSTKPRDGVRARLSLRERAGGDASRHEAAQTVEAQVQPKCPFGFGASG